MTKPHYRMTAGGDILPAIRAADGFQNLVANLGTSRDKTYGNAWITPTLSDADLLSAYRTSSVAQAMINYPAEDACREWREWQAEADQITKLEDEEARLDVVAKIKSARIRARLFGGAAIYIGTGDSNPMQPLNPERVRKGGLQFLTVLDRRELGQNDLQMDPTQPGYGLPAFYTLTGSGTSVNVHPSRLVVFRGREIPDNGIAQGLHGWGESELQAALEKVGHLDGTLANVASLVFESKVDVVKIKDFTANLREGGTAYETLMLRRFGLAMTAKGINGTLMLDAEEEYDQKSASFSTLPEIIDRMMQMVSAASGIPMTRLFGMSPAGLNATGESDLRNYYDRVRHDQTTEMQSAMRNLDECLIRSALGSRPADLHFTWRPLWQTSDKERAENADKLMSAIEKLDRLGTVPPEAVGMAAVNALTESGAMPGLEGYVDEFGGVTEPDEDDDIEAAAALGGVVEDAEPRTLYVRRNVLNASDIVSWAKSQGFKSTLPADDMHVTIAFSRKAVDWFKVGQDWEDEIKVVAGGPRQMAAFGETGDAKVLLFASSSLNYRHDRIKEAGASWDHPEYQPHITISYDPDAPSIENIEAYTGEIVLGPEIFEEVKEDWKTRIKEK